MHVSAERPQKGRQKCGPHWAPSPISASYVYDQSPVVHDSMFPLSRAGKYLPKSGEAPTRAPKVHHMWALGPFGVSVNTFDKMCQPPPPPPSCCSFAPRGFVADKVIDCCVQL